MSFQAVQAVTMAHAVHGAARAVLYVLAHHADRGGGNSFPSQKTIASEAGCCDRTVRRALSYLEGCSLIVRTGGVRSRRGRHVVVWRVMIGLIKTGHRVLVNSQTLLTNTKRAWHKATVRPVRAVLKRDGAAFTDDQRRRQALWNALASRYGWIELERRGVAWCEAQIDASLTR